MTEPQITSDALPGILAEIARITTVEVATILARTYGGRRLYVPARVPDQHPLTRLIGRPAALLIAAHLGGERHNVPAARTILRWVDAHRLRAEGKTHPQISAALGITQLHVSRLLAGAPIGAKPETGAKDPVPRRVRDTRQMTLFD
jgi:hypothetical protein